jgi:uncharacterized protein YukE
VNLAEEDSQPPGYRNTVEALLVRVMAELDAMERRLDGGGAESEQRHAAALLQIEQAVSALAESLELQGELIEAAKGAKDGMAKSFQAEALRLARFERKAASRAFWAACAACFLAGCLAGLWLAGRWMGSCLGTGCGHA